MNYIKNMDWVTRLVWGLLAWPVTIFLAILVSYAVKPGPDKPGPIVLVLALAEVVAAAVAIGFPIWAFVSWSVRGDDDDEPLP